MRAATIRLLDMMGDAWMSTGDLAAIDGRGRERMAALLRRLQEQGYVERMSVGGSQQAYRLMWRATGKRPQGTTQADRVRDALTRKWRTTADIMDEAHASRAAAQVVLNRMVDDGQALKRIEGAGQARKAYWRRAR